jgi:hypothetical protein
VLPYLVVAVLVVAIVFAARLFMKRAAEQRAAHDARLRMMANATLAAMKKKQAAAAKEATATPAAAPLREERDCPYCAEPILKKARVCKHCGRDVEPV